MKSPPTTPTPQTNSPLTPPPPHRWLEVEGWRDPSQRPLAPVMLSLATACKQISTLVRRTHTDALGGNYGEEVNIQGEQQKV